MNKLIVTLLSVLLISSALRADATTGAHFYVEPSIAFPAYIDDRGYDSKKSPGGSIAIGASFNRNHAVELEVMHFKFRDSYNYSNPNGDFYDSNLVMTPVLASYKFSLWAKKKLGFFCGVSMGFTFENENFASRRTYSYDGSTTTYIGKYSESAQPFTAGGQGGVVYAVTPHAAVTLGIKGFHANARKNERLPAKTFATLQLGLKYTL